MVKSPRSIPKSTTSGKNVNTPAETKAPVKDEKTYQYQSSTKLKYTGTKDIFDIKIERGNSPVRSPRNAQEAVKSPPQSRASFTSPPQQINTQNIAQSATNAFTRTNVTSPTQSKTTGLPISPKSQTGNVEGL